MKRMPTFFIWMMILVLIGSSIMTVPTAIADTGSTPPEEDGWIQASTPSHLKYMNQHQNEYLDKNIRLMNDIDLAGYDWIPFGGNELEGFSGTFDGRGHTITGIVINDDAREIVGFFGEVSGGHIRNLGVDVHTRGGFLTGGLVGLLDGGSIVRSFSTGSVEGKSNETGGGTVVIGGLAGSTVNAQISLSYSDVSVSGGNAPNAYSAGLAGSIGSTSVRDSYATGTVRSGSGSYAFTSGLIANSVRGTVENTYATGYVDTSGISDTPNISTSGLIASLWIENTVRRSYFDTTATGQTVGGGDGADSSIEAFARESDAMKQAATYAGWDFGSTWAIHAFVNDGYPYLRPEILTTELPDAFKDSSYFLSLEAFDGAAGGLTWSVAGDLPTGMHLSAAGDLQGTPEQTGQFDFEVIVTDPGGVSARTALQLTVVEEAPAIAVFNPEPGRVLDSVAVTAEVNEPGNTLFVVLGDDPTEQPLVGDSLPTQAFAYMSGDDILPVHSGQYLTMYEVNVDHAIQAWRSVQLEPSHIQTRTLVTGVSLEPDSLTLTVGQDPEPLTAMIEPSDATNPNVFWGSSDPEVAVVDDNGAVTAVAAGMALITVTTEDGEFTATAEITVLPAATVGTVTGSVYGSEDSPLFGADVSVADEGLHTTTDMFGNFTLSDVPTGHQTVTVSADGYKTRSVDVTVVPDEFVDAGKIYLQEAEPIPVIVPVTGVILHPHSLTLTAGQQPEPLIAVIEPADATNPNVVWSSSDPEAVTVDQDGMVTPVAAGSAQITVTTEDGGFTATAEVTVLPAVTVGTVTGSVYGNESTPLYGAEIWVAGGLRTTTDSFGSFTLSDIPSGQRTVTISAEGYETVTIDVTVIPDEITDIGRIDMTAVRSDSSGRRNRSKDNNKESTPAAMTVTVNGESVNVNIVTELDADGRTITRFIIDDSLLQAMLKAERIVTFDVDIDIPAIKIDFPASSIRDALSRDPDTVIRVQMNGISYSFPLRIWNEAPVPDASTYTAAIIQVSDSDHQALNTALEEQGFRMLAIPVDFSLYADEAVMTHHSGVYTERTMTLESTADPRTSTVVWVDEDQQPHFVPSVFKKEGDQSLVVFFAPHNSLYTAVESNRTFRDIRGHWAEADIELLANKLIVQGMPDNTFLPDEEVTRASFAAMLTRALGLVEQSGATPFADVHASDWYAGAVNAAYEADLIGGDTEGAFRPNDPITREQMAVMAARALQFVGNHDQSVTASVETSTWRFEDHAAISDWAVDSVLLMLESDLMNGTTDSTFAPQETATRAECAVVLKRMLVHLQFLNR